MRPGMYKIEKPQVSKRRKNKHFGDTFVAFWKCQLSPNFLEISRHISLENLKFP